MSTQLLRRTHLAWVSIVVSFWTKIFDGVNITITRENGQGGLSVQALDKIVFT